MENIKITVERTIEREKDKIELTTHIDSDIDDWANIFRSILTWLTFHPASIDLIFKKDDE